MRRVSVLAIGLACFAQAPQPQDTPAYENR